MPRISVVFYDTVMTSPRHLNIKMRGSRVVFGDESFKSQTKSLDSSFSLYDTRRRHFIEIGAFELMEIDIRANPWLLIRRSEFADSDCVDLSREKERLHGVIDSLASAHLRNQGAVERSVRRGLAALCRKLQSMKTWGQRQGTNASRRTVFIEEPEHLSDY